MVCLDEKDDPADAQARSIYLRETSQRVAINCGNDAQRFFSESGHSTVQIPDDTLITTGLARTTCCQSVPQRVGFGRRQAQGEGKHGSCSSGRRFNFPYSRIWHCFFRSKVLGYRRCVGGGRQVRLKGKQRKSRTKAKPYAQVNHDDSTWRHRRHAFLGADDHALVRIVTYKSICVVSRAHEYHIILSCLHLE